jgi:ATP-dependent DNA ligase
VFEPKIDGFRALAVVRRPHCELVSRNGHIFKSWPTLAAELAQTMRCRSAILDGEICCLNSDGRSDFYKLLFRRAQPYFYCPRPRGTARTGSRHDGRHSLRVAVG